MSNQHLVVIPTYNELATLESTVKALFEHNQNVDLLIVDDNSPDGTGGLADKLAKADPRIQVLHRKQKEGLGMAYLAAFDWGTRRGYKFLIEMDADGSHRAIDLPRLIETEADLVIGSRWVSGGSTENWPWIRRFISQTGNRYVRLMLGARVHDATAGFRVYRTTLIEQIVRKQIASHGYSFQVEMTYQAIRLNATIREVPIVFVERIDGESKMTTAIVLEALWLVTKLGLSRVFKN